MSIQIIKNNEINVSEEEWKELNSNLSQEDIIQLLSDAIDKVPLPLRNISIEEARADFKALKELDTTKLIQSGNVFSRYDYKYPFNGKYIDFCSIGAKASDFFHQESRFHCDSLSAPSPYRTWTVEKFRKNVLKNLWSIETKQVDSNRLRSCIALRNYIASQFRPSAAKAIYDIYKSEHVLDFCSGWGDRLAGFFASDSTMLYRGVDPNARLIKGYKGQIYEYGTVVDKSAYMYSAAAEDLTYKNESYDTIFTSPAYFDTERYTQEDNQSWKRYKVLDEWLEKFLFNVIEKCWNVLKPNGVLAINIADTYGHHKRNEMCDPMNNFISNLPNADYQGALGYRLNKRPNSAAVKDGIFVEPIFIWKKLK